MIAAAVGLIFVVLFFSLAGVIALCVWAGYVWGKKK